MKNAEGWFALTRTDARGGRYCSAAAAYRKPPTEVNVRACRARGVLGGASN